MTKIGYAAKLEPRLRQLQTGSASQHILLAAPLARKRIEAELHYMFESKRVRGEWFDLSTSDIMKAINHIDTRMLGIKKKGEMKTDLYLWMERNGIKGAQLARQIEEITGSKLSRFSISRWKRGNRKPSPIHLRALALITNGEVNYE